LIPSNFAEARLPTASGFVAVDTQVSLGAAETLQSKAKFEREAYRSGINILSYRADNGIYRSKEFMDDCKLKNQPIDFSGVGAHHHNGVAERAIRTITTCARAMITLRRLLILSSDKSLPRKSLFVF
jgi:transposase InsO family protein